MTSQAGGLCVNKKQCCEERGGHENICSKVQTLLNILQCIMIVNVHACVCCSCTMKRSWTCSMEAEIWRVATGSPILRSTRTPVAASTLLESLPDWCTQRRRCVHMCVICSYVCVYHSHSICSICVHNMFYITEISAHVS